MAPIKNILAALALASFTTAMPVDKRGNVVTETTWTTVDVTTTVYVNGASPPAQAENAPPAAPAVPTTTQAAAAESSAAPSQQQEKPAGQVQGNAPAAFAAQPAQPTPEVVSTTSAAPVAAQPTQPAAPASSPATESHGTPSKETTGGSTGGPCEGPNSGCSGDGTHWDGGLGACGWNVDTASDLSIALPVGLMGSQSNGNPYCGRSVSIKGADGSTVNAKVGDKCMGCEGDSIDMTDALFAAAFPNGDGRVKGVQWWFD